MVVVLMALDKDRTATAEVAATEVGVWEKAGYVRIRDIERPDIPAPSPVAAVPVSANTGTEAEAKIDRRMSTPASDFGKLKISGKAVKLLRDAGLSYFDELRTTSDSKLVALGLTKGQVSAMRDALDEAHD